MSFDPDIEQLLLQFLVPDNAVITAATQTLDALSAQPGKYLLVPAFLDILVNSPNPNARHLAAILIRQRIVKKWIKLPADLHSSLKLHLLHSLFLEPEPLIKKGVAGIVSLIAKFLLASNGWPELLQFIYEACWHENPSKREIGMYVISRIAQAAPDSLEEHISPLMDLFTRGLQDEHIVVGVYAVQALTELIVPIFADTPSLRSVMHASVPLILDVFRKCYTDDALSAIILDFFEEYSASMNPPSTLLTQLCVFFVDLVSSKEIEGQVRMKALSFIEWLVTRKAKTIVKMRLLPSLLNALFNLIVTEIPLQDDDEDGEDDNNQVSKYSLSVLDCISNFIPVEITYSNTMEFIQTYCQSQDPRQRKAVFAVLFAVSEGYSHYIRTNKSVLESLLSLVVNGMNDDNIHVQHSCYIVLGQFAQYCQPEIMNYHSNVLPQLLIAMNNIKDQDTQERCSYAIETFITDLDTEIVLIYMTPLMEKFMEMTHLGDAIHSVGLSGIGVIAKAAHVHFAPYFDSCIEHTKHLMTIMADDRRELFLQATDTLGCLLSTVNVDVVIPHIEQIMQLSLNALQTLNDPDVRCAIYSLFGSICETIKSQFCGYLSIIMERVFQSVNNQDALQVHRSIGSVLPKTQNNNDDDNDDDEDQDLGYSLNMAYVNEQIAACQLLVYFAKNINPEFVTYLPTAIECVLKIRSTQAFSHVGLRKVVFKVITHLICESTKLTQQPAWQKGIPVSIELNETLSSFCSIVIPMLLTALEDEEENKKVLLLLLECVEDVILTIGPALIQSNIIVIDQLIDCLLDFFDHTNDQNDNNEDEEDDDNTGAQDDDDEQQQQGEIDFMLIENAADVIAAIAKVLGGAFSNFIDIIFPRLLGLLQSNKAVSERSTAVGVLAVIIESMETSSQIFGNHLIPILISLLEDENCEVRSNAAFTMGILCQFADNDMVVTHFPNVLQSLHQHCIASNLARAADNAIAAVSRMMIAFPHAIPVEHVIPVIIDNLPLKEDVYEYLSVLQCLKLVLQSNPDQLRPYFHKLADILASVHANSPTEAIKEEAMIVSGLLSLHGV